MKAWEKHQVDLYLLANDILENLYHQRHGYKSNFYYDFNYGLNYLQSNGSYNAQIKLLDQLQDQDIVEYELMVPGEHVTDDFISKNVQRPWENKKLIRIITKPYKFNEVYEKLKPYAPSGEQPLLQNHRMVYLRADATQVVMLPTYDKREYPIGKFRAGGRPAEIISFLITTMPNTKVNKETLADNGYQYSGRKLNEMARDVFNELAYKTFILGPKSNSITILSPVDIEIGTLETLITEAEN